MDERQIAALVAIYRAAFDELTERLARAVERGNDTTFLRAQLADVLRLLVAVDAEARQWIEQQLPAAYRQGQLATIDELRQAGALPRGMTATFAGVHRTAVELLAENLVADLTDATRLVGRRVDDVFRRLGLETAARMRATGTLARQGARELRDDLLARGLTGFVDGAGRQWRLDDYADMTIRTTVIEAGNLGRINQQTEAGHDLVKMTEHHPTCPICAVYQGRVYSVSGNDPRYPALYETAFSRGYNIVHPRCGHSVALYIEHLADDPDGDRERSTKPFDVDPRTEKQRKAYEEGQRRKRQLREDRRQWERYRAALPEETPATFSAFRRMKGTNSAGWQRLQRGYRMESGQQSSDRVRDLRHRRQAQLAAMDDQAFADEVRAHQEARWRGPALIEHAKEHRRHYAAVFGKAFSAPELDEISRTAMVSWDRLFTGLQFDQSAYMFVSEWTSGGAMLVVVARDQRIRTVLSTRSLDTWLARHQYVIEVTDRARRLGL